MKKAANLPEVQPIQMAQRPKNELILSSAYEELLYYHLMGLRRLKYAVAFLFGFWACALLVEIRLWLGCP